MLPESPSLVGEKAEKEDGEGGERGGVEEVLAEELRVLQEGKNTLDQQLQVHFIFIYLFLMVLPL